MYSNKPFYTAESLDGGGVAATTTEVKTEPTNTDENGGAGDEPQEPEEDDFSYDSDETQSGEPSGSPSGAPHVPAAGEAKGEVVSKVDYEKVVSELNATKNELAQLKQMLDQPILKTGLDYLTAKAGGANIEPQEFFEQTFGLDSSRLSAEDLIQLEVREEAARIGVSMSDDEIEQEYEQRLQSYENLTTHQKHAKTKELRDKHAASRREKLQKLVDEKTEASGKSMKYWEAQAKLIQNEVEELVKAGKKDFGAKSSFTQTDKEKVLGMIDNNFLKFDADKNVNVKHVIEVAMFAADKQGYLKRYADKAVERYKLEELKKRASGQSLNPSAVTLPDGTQKPKKVEKLKLVPMKQ